LRPNGRIRERRIAVVVGMAITTRFGIFVIPAPLRRGREGRYPPARFKADLRLEACAFPATGIPPAYRFGKET